MNDHIGRRTALSAFTQYDEAERVAHNITYNESLAMRAGAQFTDSPALQAAKLLLQHLTELVDTHASTSLSGGIQQSTELYRKVSAQLLALHAMSLDTDTRRRLHSLMRRVQLDIPQPAARVDTARLADVLSHISHQMTHNQAHQPPPPPPQPQQPISPLMASSSISSSGIIPRTSADHVAIAHHTRPITLSAATTIASFDSDEEDPTDMGAVAYKVRCARNTPIAPHFTPSPNHTSTFGNGGRTTSPFTPTIMQQPVQHASVAPPGTRQTNVMQRHPLPPFCDPNAWEQQAEHNTPGSITSVSSFKTGENPVVVTCHMNGVIHVWHLTSINPVGTFREHTAAVTISVAMKGSIVNLLTGSKDGTVRRFDLVQMKCAQTYYHRTSSTGQVTAVHHDDGNYVLSGTTTARVVIWSLSSGDVIHVVSNIHRTAVTGIHILTQDSIFSSDCECVTHWQYRPETKEVVTIRTFQTQGVGILRGMEYDDGYLVLVYDSGDIALHDVSGASNVVTFDSNLGVVLTDRTLAAPYLLAVGEGGQTTGMCIRMWHLPTLTMVMDVPYHDITHFRFLEGGKKSSVVLVLASGKIQYFEIG